MPKTPERIGQVIGDRYEVLDVIGRGGQGLVYRVHDRWMQRDVAIKVLGSKAAREPHMVERLMREQQALSALRGTAAVELFDVCRGNDGELCLVMELLRGMDLDEHLYEIERRAERLPLTRVAEIFDPIVSTLETAHAAGILHRDLKPANIYLLEGGDVRLLDFGMARLRTAAPLTAAGTIMGSPSFMAPEAWRGLSDLVDHRADVYSLGVILFRVLAGDLPFGGDTLKDKFLGATTGKRPSLLALRPDLPSRADEWVALALALDREARFANVRALWNAFLTVFGVEPPRRGKRQSLWAAARDAVKKLAGTSDPAPGPPPLHASSNEPSFMRDVLARSALHVSTPIDDAQADALAERPSATSAPRTSSRPTGPSRRPPAPPRPRSAPTREATVVLGDEDFLVDEPDTERMPEPTFTLSDTDFVDEDAGLHGQNTGVLRRRPFLRWGLKRRQRKNAAAGRRRRRRALP